MSAGHYHHSDTLASEGVIVAGALFLLFDLYVADLIAARRGRR